MSTQVTSPAGHGTLADSTMGQWQSFFAYLKRPTLPTRATGIGAEPLTATLRLLALDILLTLGVLAFFYILTLLGVEAPDNVMEDLEFTPTIIALIVIGAPLGEEILFRGWLSGRPGHVLAMIFVGLGLLAIPVAAGIASGSGTEAPVGSLAGGAGLVIGIALAILALWYWRNSGPWRWFAMIFPVLLPLSALLFASVHLFNYEADISPLLWLFVVPQFIAGLIFGYARVNYGLWSSILLHILHNGTAMTAILTFGDLA